MVKLNNKRILKAIEGSNGNITLIANKLNVSRKAVYDYLVKNPKIKQEIEQEKEKVVDIAEAVVYSKMQEKDLNAAKVILLNTKRGRERGYGEVIEHKGDMSHTVEKIQVEIIRKNDIEIPDNEDL